MIQYEHSASTYAVSRAAVLLDTNMLCSRFDSRSENHETTVILLDEYLFDAQFIVPLPVIVEAWGLLVGSRKNWEAGELMLEWLRNPGNFVLVLEHGPGVFDKSRVRIQELKIDCVDAILLEIASDISLRCAMKPPLPILSYDRRDFLRAFGQPGLVFSLLDPDTQEVISST